MPSDRYRVSSLILFLSACGLLQACGGGTEQAKPEQSLASSTPTVAALDAAASGAEAAAPSAASAPEAAASAAASASVDATPATAAATPLSTTSQRPTAKTQAAATGSPSISTRSTATAAVGSATNSGAVTSADIAAAGSTIWTAPELTATAPVSSGDGLTTTASSSKSLALPAAGVFYGIREAKEDWATLAAKLKTSTDVATWVKAQKTDVDNWAAKNRERADMVGGWVQNYLDPKTGALVTWTPDSPEPAKIAGTGEQKYYEAWVAYGRGYNIARTQMAARIYRLTGEAKYGEWAAKQLDFYAKNYKTWPVRTFNGRGQMYRHGLDEAYDSFTLVDAARLLEGYAGTARSAAWRDGLFLPMAENLKTVTSPMTNISLWHYAAMAGIGVRYKNSTLLDYAQNSSQGMLAVLKNGVTADNLWIEGTFAYNDYVVDALSKLLVGASLEGQSSRFSAERDYTLRLLLAAFDYRFADNMLPNPSDSAARLPVATPAVHWKLFRVLPTYYGVDLASRWRTWESLLDPPASTTLTAPQLPAVYTRNFPAIRMAVLKSGTWQAFVHYGQAAANHAQEEALTYELYEGNTQISTDSGTVSYTSPYHTDYFSRGPANNVVLIDGLGQVSWNKGEVSSFSATENRLVAKQASYRPGASVSRGYRVTSSGFAEQTSIALSSLQAGLLPAAKRLGLAFHSACQIAPLAGLNPSATTPLPSAIGLSYWTDLAMWTAGSSWQAKLTCGSKSYTLSVSGPGSQRVYIGKAPTTPLPTKRAVLYFETVGTSANFSSEIRPSN